VQGVSTTTGSIALSLGNTGGTYTGSTVGIYVGSNAGNLNPVVQAGDSLLTYSAGTAGTGVLTIAPWSSTGAGLRMDSSGNCTHTGRVNLTTGNAYQVNGVQVLEGQQTGLGTAH
jgi:hypothetical protein